MKNMHWDLTTRYEILLKINNAVISNPEKNSFFNAFINELKKHIPFDGATIHLYDHKKQDMSLYAASGHVIENFIGKNNRPLSMSYFAQKVVLSRKPIIIEDLSPYCEHFPVADLMKIGIRSTLAFPLIIQGRVFATLHFLFRQVPEHINELSEMLIEISHQVAIAINVIAAYNYLKEENESLVQERNYLFEQSSNYTSRDIIYDSQKMKELMNTINQVADTDASVLITGETGTGKDLIARHLHNVSARREKLLVKVNCPALTSSLFESELFGHSKGAFTGADSNRIGRFETANGGTLFLDEISELSIGQQAKLLQVLQESCFERVGESQSIYVNCRIIAATNENLEQRIIDGAFRRDFYYRLNIIKIHVPSLRERKEDIPILINYINQQKSNEIRRKAPYYTPEALDFLTSYDWPGNVRELKNLVTRMVILHADQEITVDKIRTIICLDSNSSGENNSFYPVGAMTTLSETERDHIKAALMICKGVVGGPDGAAEMLGIARSTLRYKLKKHNLNPKDF
jgi:formate hydrogenlyase transcriptional activator